jgi:putative nucleotidyltransferase with HDIG domain
MAERLVGIKASDAVGRTLGEVYTVRQRVSQDGKDGNLSILVGKKGNEYLIEETRTSTRVVENGEAETVIIVRYISGRDEAEGIRHNYEASLEQLRKVLGATVNAIVAIAESRDPYTAGHQRRVSDLGRAIAKEMGLTADQIDSIRIAGNIHDIGKMSIPAEILSKPAKLKKAEFEMIKEHPMVGYNILKDIEFPWPIAKIVLQHHERIDGSGYPNGLAGNQILVESKIIAVADVVEAIASHRPYRPALGIDVALKEIQKGKGSLYDTAVVDTCLHLFRKKGYKMESS